MFYTITSNVLWIYIHAEYNPPPYKIEYLINYRVRLKITPPPIRPRFWSTSECSIIIVSSLEWKENEFAEYSEKSVINSR